MGEGTELQKQNAEGKGMSWLASFCVGFCTWFSFSLFKTNNSLPVVSASQCCLAVFFEELVILEGPGGPPQSSGSLFLQTRIRCGRRSESTIHPRRLQIVASTQN